MGRVARGAVAALAGVGLLVALGPRIPVETEVAAPEVPRLEALDPWLAEAEAGVPGLRDGTGKTIVWADPAAPARTPFSVVYLHGFSATRQETAPLADSVAAGLRANLYYPRLRGHGRDGDAMAEATVAAWIRDAREALEVGRRLGERVIVVGTSTGATLALYAAARLPEAEAVAAVVAISPNFGPADPTSRILLWPWGGWIARVAVGPTRSWEPANEAQGRFWTTTYPTAALLPMMGLVSLVDDGVLAAVGVPTLVLYSPADQVVDVQAIRRRSGALGGTPVVVEAVEHPVGDPSSHVLAGDILSPGTTRPLARRILAFLRETIGPSPGARVP